MKTLSLTIMLVLLVPLSAQAWKHHDDALLASFLQQERRWAGLQTRQAEIDGHKLVYSEGGDRAAPALVLLHGFSGSRDNWNRVAHYLSPHFHLIIPDMPGHGDSPLAANQDASPVAMAYTVIGLLEKLGITHYHLAGHSLGATFATQIGVVRGSMVESVTLLDGAGVYQTVSPLMARVYGGGENPLLVRKPGDFRRVMGLVMNDAPFFPEEVIRPMERRQIAHLDNYKRVFAAANALRKNYTPDTFRNSLRFLRPPVLLIWGAQDKLFPPATMKEIQPVFKSARAVVLDGVGHTPIIEAPRKTARAMQAFIASQAGASVTRSAAVR
ncbi:MAG: alpha/beta fold hydrolase [Alcanivorax sp.]|nr:alpha/beta fold hydrolase [Alcanivorax sp.]